MPRPRSAENEAARRRQEAYRKGLEARGEPETDAVDTALAAAVSTFLGPSLKGSPGSRKVAGSIIRKAVKHLVSSGFDADAAGRRLSSRIYYLQMDHSYPHATPGDRYRWTMGEQAVPDPISYESDIDPMEVDAGPHDHDYEFGDYDDEAA